MDLSELRRLVKHGEGSELEFKRKANHPDKIAREIIAFANTKGGKLLVGVDDDGSIYGSKYPEEDAFAIQQVLRNHCFPPLSFRIEHIQVNARRNVLAIHVNESNRKPHYLKLPPNGRKMAFVRVNDMSTMASREMIQILRHARNERGVSIEFGDEERKLLQHFEANTSITLSSTQQLLNISKRKASTKLVLLARAGILLIHPTGKGDYFTLSQDAFDPS